MVFFEKFRKKLIVKYKLVVVYYPALSEGDSELLNVADVVNGRNNNKNERITFYA